MTLLINVFKFIINVVYLFFKLFKTKNKITLISRQSNSITPDFYLLSEELKKELKDYEIVVICKKIDNKILYAFNMLKQMYHIATSKIVILDSYSVLISNLKHKKDLKVIQIWHALGLMKKAGYAIIGKEEGRNEKISRLLNMHKNYDYVFTTSESCRKSMSEVFGCDINIVKSVPLPRIDYLKNENHINKRKNKIYSKYKILKDKENVIYAPTFRKNEEEMEKQINTLINNFNYDKYNLIIKLHPLSKIKIDNDKVIVPNEFSTLDMIYVSDYVIGDYSSLVYEAGILKKKQIFFPFDLNNYKDNRDFFIDYEKEVPGPIFMEAKDIIDFLNEKGYTKVRDDLTGKYVDLSIKNYTKNMVDKIKIILKEGEIND